MTGENEDEQMFSRIKSKTNETWTAEERAAAKHTLFAQIDRIEASGRQRTSRRRNQRRKNRAWPTYLAAAAAVVVAGAGIMAIAHPRGTAPTAGGYGNTKGPGPVTTTTAAASAVSALPAAHLSYVHAIQMAGTQMGIMDGFNNNQFVVAATSDGGTTWHALPAPPNAPSRSGDPTITPSITLTKGNEVVVAWDEGGSSGNTAVIDTTSDWGTHWQTHTLSAGNMGASIEALSAVQSRLYLVQSYGAAMSREQHTVLRSDDGGATWQTVSADSGYVPAPSGVTVTQNALPESLQTPSFTWIDPSTGFVAMSAAGGMAPPSSVPLFVTTDGGKSWIPASISPPSGVDLKNSYMAVTAPVFAGQTGTLTVMTNGYNGSTTNNTLTVYQTTDGGQHWQPVHQVPVGSGPILVSFVSPSTGWYFDRNNGSLVETTDGGKSWQTVQASGLFGLNPQSQDSVSLRMLNATSGVAVVTNTSPQAGQQFTSKLYKTNDGGKTWQIVSLG